MSNPTQSWTQTAIGYSGRTVYRAGLQPTTCPARIGDAWNEAVGEPCCRQTQLGEVRRGVLNVTVAHSTLLEELSAFRKPSLLKALRSAAPATIIHDIRFRVGPVVPEVEPKGTTALVRHQVVEDPQLPSPLCRFAPGRSLERNEGRLQA